MVHFFSKETAESFTGELETASDSDTMKDRHRREVRLLAIVLANLHGSSPLFRNVRRWIWEKRLNHSKYNEVEAMQLLGAAVMRIHQGKMIDLYLAIVMADVQATIEATERTLDEIEQLYNEKLKVWKGEQI